MEKKKFEKPKKASASAASSDEIFKIPKITREPANKQMKIGQKLILRVEAQGVPSPTYQWYQNGIKIPGAVNNSFVMKTRGNNGGAYTCEAKNFVGSVMSKSAMISFFAANKLPPLKIEPENLIVALGKACKFRLVDLSDEDLKGVSLQWFFNGRKISGVTSDTLEFTEVKKKYEGEYKVIATKNSTMVASNVVKLSVAEANSSDLGETGLQEFSLADMLLTKEIPSLHMASQASLKSPTPPALPRMPEGDALLESLSGEDTFFDPGESEEDQFFTPDTEDDEAFIADDQPFEAIHSPNQDEVDTDGLYAALQESPAPAPKEKKSPIVVVHGAPDGAPEVVPEEAAPAAVIEEQIFSEPVQAVEAISNTSEVLAVAVAAPEPEQIPAPQRIVDLATHEKLLAKKAFLEKLLYSVATLKNRESITPENPLTLKIERQKQFLLKLRENVLAKKKEAA